MYNLYYGDCLEVMDRLIESKTKVDAIITDPPYGTTACKWDSVIPFEPMWERLNKLIKDNGVIALFGSEPFSSHLRLSNEKMYKYDWTWYKNRPSGMAYCKHQPMRAVENIMIFYNKQCLYNPQMTKRTEQELKRFNKNKVTFTRGTNINGFKFGMAKIREDSLYKYPHNVLQYSVVSNSSKDKTIHPTQKPVALMEYLIKTYTNEGDTILDFTMGSGSTGVACINTKRDFIGIELDGSYYDIAEKRLKDASTSIFDI